MMQQITKEMWDELSNEEKGYFMVTNPFQSMCSNKYHPSDTRCNNDCHKSIFQPTVGQLIEFLGGDWLFQLKNVCNGSETDYGIEVVECLLEPRFILENCWKTTKYKLRNR